MEVVGFREFVSKRGEHFVALYLQGERSDTVGLYCEELFCRSDALSARPSVGAHVKDVYYTRNGHIKRVELA